MNIYEWATGSTARFYNVPWESDYKDVVHWTKDQRDTYFEQRAIAAWTLSNMQYLRAGEAITVPLPYDDIWNANYIVITNADAPFAENKPVTLCYFVTGVTYQAPNSTLIDVQLDAWQTYALGMELGTCYVERGHVTVAAAACKAARLGRSIADSSIAQEYYGEPEGLDIGSDYQVARHFFNDFSNLDNKGLGVLVVATADLEKAWGTIESPSLSTADSRVVDGLPSGAGVYFFTSKAFSDFMKAAQDAPWISKSVTMCVGVPAALIDGVNVSVGGVAAIRVQSDNIIEVRGMDWDMHAGFKNIYSAMGDGLSKFGKFNTYPYTYYQIDSNNGSPLLLKPELCQGVAGPDGANSILHFQLVSVVVPPHLRIAIVPSYYGVNQFERGAWEGDTRYSYSTFAGSYEKQLNIGQNLSTAAWIQTFPQFALVNDEYLNYLVSTQNTRAAQYAGAGWSLERSNASAELAYNQAQTNFQYAVYDNEIRNQQFQNNLMGSVGNAALGALGQAFSGNFGGALSTVGSTAINSAVGIANNDLTNQSFYNNATKNLALAGQNRGLAEWSNRGDYQQAIKALNATVRDAALTQPSMSGQAGGEGFAMASGNFGYNLRVMAVGVDRARAIGDYWSRYGYACNRYVTINKNLNLMTKYTYWKCADTYVLDFEGDESSKSVIRGILERGVTVWRRPDDIGHVGLSYDNDADTSVGALY